MFKKRSRPQTSQRTKSEELEDEKQTLDQVEKESADLSLEDLLTLRKLKKNRQGIDIMKLSKGDGKRKKRARDEDTEAAKYELSIPSSTVQQGDEEDSDEEGAKARKAVRTNNFTQQTNTQDVDKHMMAYIEENMKTRKNGQEPEPETSNRRLDPQEELYRLTATSLGESKKLEEGNVTNSMAMLTAIPEVDLGMDARLKNIEETEKAKRLVAEERLKAVKSNRDEEHLAATRFHNPHAREMSERDIYRNAKAEAEKHPPEEDPRQPYSWKGQTATDEAVMERFKKRMRK